MAPAAMNFGKGFESVVRILKHFGPPAKGSALFNLRQKGQHDKSAQGSACKANAKGAHAAQAGAIYERFGRASFRQDEWAGQ
jgi:hypothetical protein